MIERLVINAPDAWTQAPAFPLCPSGQDCSVPHDGFDAPGGLASPPGLSLPLGGSITVFLPGPAPSPSLPLSAAIISPVFVLLVGLLVAKALQAAAGRLFG